MSNFDFMSVPKVILILAVIILYITVTLAIIKSIIIKKKRCSPFNVPIICSEKYKGIEKRRHERFPVDLAAELSDETRTWQTSVSVKDFSPLGVRCEAPQVSEAVSAGTRGLVTFQGPEELAGCRVLCRIVWKKHEEGLCVLGLEFLEKSKKLDSFVEHLRKHTAC